MRSDRHQCRGKLLGEQGARSVEVEVGIGAGQVSDQHGIAGTGLADGGGRTADTGKRLQRIVDLAELDASAAELDLIVGAALEQQTFELEFDQVTTAVGAVPPERRHWRVLLGVLRRVQVACESDSADDELTDLADGNWLAGSVDDGEIPAVER